MIRRTLDPRFLNYVANEPDVRPWIGGEGILDLSGLIGNPANVALETEAGGWVFVRHEAGTYELHTLFQPGGRGRNCLAAWKEAARYMFASTDAREIVTRVPANNRGADFAARHCGFRERFARVDAFKDPEGRLCGVSYRALTLDDWWPKDEGAAKAGELFHAQMEAAQLRSDQVWPDHPQDDSHDRAAGAACLMILAGNPRKGAWFYNRWASLAGYPPIQILTETPLVIDVGSNVIVEMRDGEMEVLLCRLA